MLKSDKVISLLIKDGYNDELATLLPKLFIADFFDKEQAKISESIDILINRVQNGQITPDANNNVNFAGIIKMGKNDMDLNSINGLFYNFKTHITEEFMYLVQKKPLSNILLNAGALKYSSANKYPIFTKEIVESPIKYQDLCEVRPYVEDYDSLYIKVSDLYSLLLNKGFSSDNISIIWGEYGFGPRYPRNVQNEGIYINYDAIMEIGNPSYSKIKKTKNSSFET